MKRRLLNNVNTGIDFSTADNKYLYIMKVIVGRVPTATATFDTSDETYSIS